MEQKLKNILLKLLLLLLSIPIVYFGSNYLKMQILLFRFLYPYVFLSLLARIILDYFDKFFYGDYLFIISVLISRYYGFIPSLILLPLVLIIYHGFKKVVSPPVILHFFSTLIFVFLSPIFQGTSVLVVSIGSLVGYTIITTIGYNLLKLEKKYLLIDLSSNIFALITGVLSLNLIFAYLY